MFRVCERFGFSVSEFKNLDRWEQGDYLAYEFIRAEEEFNEMSFIAGVKIK